MNKDDSIGIEKINLIVDDKLELNYKLYTLETKNLILSLREEIKSDLLSTIKEVKQDFYNHLDATEKRMEASIESALNAVKERTNWRIEILKLSITIISVLSAMKYLRL
tara:strand:+ start:756 stop:1082 length:327 start_codon:yes stop_codon:yes gene_type:complete